MAPREVRVLKGTTITPLSGGAADKLRESMKVKSSANGGVNKGAKVNPAKAAAEAKAAAKAKRAEAKAVEELGWVAFTVKAPGVSLDGVEFAIISSAGQEYPGTLSPTGGGQVAKLKPGQVSLKLQLPKPPVVPESLEVRLVDTDGDPLAHAEYVLTGATGTKLRGTTDSNGHFYRSDLDAGTWSLSLAEAGPSQRRLELEVVDTNGRPLANVPVVLVSPGGTKLRKFLDGNGYLLAEGLKPGTWSLQANVSSHAADSSRTR